MKNSLSEVSSSVADMNSFGKVPKMEHLRRLILDLIKALDGR
jgi:hypothetical protein